MDTNQHNLILIVDDNQTNIKVLFELLQEAGFRVLVAKNGESAIEKLEAVKPDLILLDVMMPGIDGFETCRRLKASSTTQDIPVIFMTALSDSVDKVKGLTLGAVDYITKPFQQEEILARIDIHLKLHNLNKDLERRVAERTIELTEALAKLQESQLQLVQNEKMSTLGQLVAGIAHEINNPLNFIKNNLTYAEKYIKDLIDHVQLCQQQSTPEILKEHAATVDLDYLLTDLPKLLSSMKKGTERLSSISVSLRTFSRADITTQVPFDLHEGLDSTLFILQHRLKGDDRRPPINIVREYGDLPLVECFPGQLNQVFMNLLANAVDAIEQSNQGRSFEEIQDHPNQITIQTRVLAAGDRVQVRIRDNGTGISPEVKQRIFNYSFTTKPVGLGTGLGLSIARQIVMDKHGGTLEVESELGQGSEFIVTIPIQGTEQDL